MTDTSVRPTFQARIDALRLTKKTHTRQKLTDEGTHDVDDHGRIPWPDSIPFTVRPNHPNGRAHGIRAIGENFREWLRVHPVYIHPMSALAGAWMQIGIPDVGG